MWSEADKWLTKFSEAGITVVDADGYPFSVRQITRCNGKADDEAYDKAYDKATGELLVSMPEPVRAMPGRATLMCHYHDENLWNLTAIQIKGRLEHRCGDWVFVSTAFTPPANGQLHSLWQLSKRIRAAANSYLGQRGLERPAVNWTAINTLHRRARESTQH